MVRAPLYWPPASNLGSLCITPVWPCRYHPPESRGAVSVSGRCCIYFHIQPSKLQIPAYVSGPCCLPSALVWPAQSTSITKGTPPRRHEATHKPWREGKVVENTIALLQHCPQTALPGSCAHTENAWWDSQKFWPLLLPTISSKQFGTTSLLNSCFPLQAYGKTNSYSWVKWAKPVKLVVP